MSQNMKTCVKNFLENKRLSISALLVFLIIFGAAIKVAYGDERPSLVINEFAPTASVEWVELANVGNTDIDLANWTLQSSNGQVKALSGTVPAHGLLTFGGNSSIDDLNDAGDYLVLSNGSQQIFAVSYGASSTPDSLHIDEIPNTSTSISLTASGTLAVSSVPTKGWFNEDSGVISMYDLFLEIERENPGISTNLGQLDPTKATGLFFAQENRTSGIYGKIVFTDTLNLTDTNTISLLQELGNKLTMSNGHIGLDASTADKLKNAHATITMYGLNYASRPSLIVKDDNGQIISDQSFLSNFSYVDNTFDACNGQTPCKDLVFSTEHFTSFDVDNNIYVDASAINEGAGTQTSPFKTIQSALNAASDGSNIRISAGTYEFTSQLNITKPLSIIGEGAVTFKKAEGTTWSTTNGSKHLVAIYSGTSTTPVKLSNITINASSTYGVNTYNNAYGVLENVTIENSLGAGLTVNGSTIVATNLTTRGNAWGAVNVDPGSGVTAPSVFTLNSGTLSENKKIWSDGDHVTDTAVVTVTADGYNKYNVVSDGIKNFIWTNEIIHNGAFITNNNVSALYSSIQNAINSANSGDLINIGPGTYSESITINKQVNLTGAGSADNSSENTIITGTGANPAVTLSASGSQNNTLKIKNIRLTPTERRGIEVIGNIDYVDIDNIKVIGTASLTSCTENEVGLRVYPGNSLSNTTITNSEFSKLAYGWYLGKNPSGSTVGDTSNVSGLTVNNMVVSGNALKGLYIEKLSNTNFTDLTVDGNGINVSASCGLNSWNSGVDINLKNGNYANITFTRPTITNNGLGVKEGTGITIKARGTGSDNINYGASTSLEGVVIDGAVITNNERGVRIGEPGKNNLGPNNVVIKNSKIYNNTKTYSGSNGSDYGDLINKTVVTNSVEAKNNWWGTIDPIAIAGMTTGTVNFRPWLSAENASADEVAPTLTITPTISASSSATTTLNLSFSEEPVNFSSSTITVSNGTLSDFSGTGTNYTVTVTATNNGIVQVTLPANIVADQSGNYAAQTIWQYSYDTVAPTFEKWGDGTADFVLAPGQTISKQFSEHLADSSARKILDALDAAADSDKLSRGFSHGDFRLTITNTGVEPVVFPNDVVALITDDAGNESEVLLIDSKLETNQLIQAADIALTADKPEVVVIKKEAVDVNVPLAVNNPIINVDNLIDNNTLSGILPAIAVTADTSVGQVSMNIPADTEATGAAGWTGLINLPTIKDRNSVIVTPDTGKTASVENVIEVGFDDVKLSFDKAVRIKIAGAAGKVVGYSRAGVFQKILTVCSNDTQTTNDLLPADGECYLNVGGDLVIWTKHFTKFITYTQANISNGGGGGGYYLNNTTTPTVATTTTSIVSTVTEPKKVITETKNETPVVKKPVAPNKTVVLGVKVLADGTLVKNAKGNIWVVYNNKRVAVKNLVELKKYKGPITKMSDQDLANYPIVKSIQVAGVKVTKTYINGDVVRDTKTNKIYQVKNGKLVHIKTLAELKKLGKKSVGQVDTTFVKNFGKTK